MWVVLFPSPEVYGVKNTDEYTAPPGVSGPRGEGGDVPLGAGNFV